ncbi:MAG: PKD domain-containing protein [Longimicrobiales bacterium]|nr:PKD domain-containing protein [Longimicrobiales bacterium]
MNNRLLRGISLTLVLAFVAACSDGPVASVPEETALDGQAALSPTSSSNPRAVLLPPTRRDGPQRASQIGQPVPASVIVSYNGIEWVWASPCALNGCTSGIDVGHDGFRFATVAEWALRPAPSAFRSPDKCAAPWFDFTHNHCDWQDAEIYDALWGPSYLQSFYGSAPSGVGGAAGGWGYPMVSWAETWLVRVNNQPPTANAGPDQIVECTGATTSVTLNGSASSDPDGDALTYSWSWTGGSASGASPTISLPDGTHTITLTVDDGKGGTDTDEVVVNIVDTTPPTLSFALLTTELWPPNHTMHTVATVSASDICDSSASVAITVTSNEPDNGLGDGDTAGDWAVIDNGDGTYSVQVRAERGGKGTGRVYTISVTATDDSTNSSSASGQVKVPHSKGK